MEGIARITILKTPPSLNQVGSRGQGIVYWKHKKGWQRMLEGELTFGTASDVLPQRVDRVTVTGRMEFKTNRRRDEGNFRSVVEKALGDALTNGGRLDDDTGERYQFGELELIGGAEQNQTILDLHWTAG